LLSYAGSSAALRLANISARQALWCEVPGMTEWLGGADLATTRRSKFRTLMAQAA